MPPLMEKWPPLRISWQNPALVCTVQIEIKFPFQNSGSTLRRVITEGTLEPCHLLLVLSTCLIALVGVASNITKSKNIIIRHVDNTR